MLLRAAKKGASRQQTKMLTGHCNLSIALDNRAIWGEFMRYGLENDELSTCVARSEKLIMGMIWKFSQTSTLYFLKVDAHQINLAFIEKWHLKIFRKVHSMFRFIQWISFRFLVDGTPINVYSINNSCWWDMDCTWCLLLQRGEHQTFNVQQIIFKMMFMVNLWLMVIYIFEKWGTVKCLLSFSLRNDNHGCPISFDLASRKVNLNYYNLCGWHIVTFLLPFSWFTDSYGCPILSWLLS